MSAYDPLLISVKSLLARELGAAQDVELRTALDDRLRTDDSEALRITPTGDTHITLSLTRTARDLDADVEARGKYEFICDSCGEIRHEQFEIETRRACVRPINWDPVEDEADGSMLIETNGAQKDQVINLRALLEEELLMAQPMKLVCDACAANT